MKKYVIITIRGDFVRIENRNPSKAFLLLGVAAKRKGVGVYEANDFMSACGHSYFFSIC